MQTTSEIKVRTYKDSDLQPHNVFYGAERVASKSHLTGWDNIESLEYSLSYHYNRVYINYTYIFNGIRLQSGQKPITSAFPAELDIAKQLFEADKKSGFISSEYQFV